MNPEIQRRRTFAIVSHPDAGKTTLTEKLLLYGGALQLAGSVTARKNQRATTSDWMELERKRGISISSTVLQFDYRGFRINLLDTPGHKDFSEDTYRVLTAVDSAVMVIDAGKGIESQTRKLFEVCRRRGIPIFTFMNKMDRPARDCLELVDELESVLGIKACPMNWPLGSGSDFKGIYDRATRNAHLFERTPGGIFRAPMKTAGLTDPEIVRIMDPLVHKSVCEEVSMIEGAGASFNAEAVSAGELTPVYFGSASNNFGVQLLLDGFLEWAPPPTPRASGERQVSPDDPDFSGFVFKIQANMDPRHRDCVAFIRVVSGKFERDMTVTHVRTGRQVRLSNSSKIFGRERTTVDEGYAGDIVGIVGNSLFGIGDTVTTDPAIRFHEVPRFSPECFASLHNTTTSNYKRFRDGLSQLLQEGVVQAFETPYAVRRTPLLGAVGPLQFEIVQYRLESEYGATSRLEPEPWKICRWIAKEPEGEELLLPQGSRRVQDLLGRPVLMFLDDFALRYFTEKNPKVELTDLPGEAGETGTWGE